MKRTPLSLTLLVLAGLALAVQGCGKVNRAASSGGGDTASTSGAQTDGSTTDAAPQEFTYHCEIEAGKLRAWVDDEARKLWLQGMETAEEKGLFGRMFADPVTLAENVKERVQYGVCAVVGDNDGINGTWELAGGASLVDKKMYEITGQSFYKTITWGDINVAKISFTFAKDKDGETGQVTAKFNMKMADDPTMRECAVTSEATFKTIQLKPEEARLKDFKQAFEIELKAASSGELKFTAPAK